MFIHAALIRMQLNEAVVVKLNIYIVAIMEEVGAY
jgi:hypothetical protein